MLPTLVFTQQAFLSFSPLSPLPFPHPPLPFLGLQCRLRYRRNRNSFFCRCHFFLVFLLLMIVHLFYILYYISSSLLFLNSSTKSLTSRTLTRCFGIPYRNQSREIIISVSNHSCQNVRISAVPPWVKAAQKAAKFQSKEFIITFHFDLFPQTAQLHPSMCKPHTTHSDKSI